MVYFKKGSYKGNGNARGRKSMARTKNPIEQDYLQKLVIFIQQSITSNFLCSSNAFVSQFGDFVTSSLESSIQLALVFFVERQNDFVVNNGRTIPRAGSKAPDQQDALYQEKLY
jgi:hypothetical protein